MTALMLATRLSWVLDFVALVALAGTGEVRLEIFAIAAALFILSRSGFLKFGEKPVLGVLIGLLLFAVGAWFKYRFHPILAASYLAPLVHSVLFFAPETGRYRGWRIGLGFIQMILASALAPDAYLFPAIFVFVLVAAVAVSSGFLDDELSQRAPDHRELPLPGGFIRHSMTLAFLIFLTSLIIFPILPRTNMGGGAFDSFKVGYTEHVELSEKKGLNGHEGTGEPVLRLYAQPGVDLSAEIYLGLIRGKTLDIFDGSNWISSSKRARAIGIKYVKPTETRDAIWVDADRSPVRSNSLPVPYGTVQVQSGMSIEDAPFPKSVGGEWVDSLGADSRVRYSFAFHPYRKYLRSSAIDEDPPSSLDLSVPEALKSARMDRLGKRLFAQSMDATQKAERLMAFFSREKFTASLSNSTTEAAAMAQNGNPIVERMHPMERFLFLTKEGHCEWFASSSVILLRMAGVPARLVAGFRIAKGPVGGVMTITTNDAHAWVEYWNPSKGWTALDPTPRLLGPSGFFNVFRDGYEWVSAYWYRYVLNFTESRAKNERDLGGESARPEFKNSGFKEFRTSVEGFAQQHRDEILWGVLSFALFGFAFYLFIKWRYPWFFSIRYRIREGERTLRRERIKMERLIQSKTSAQNIEDAIEILKSSALSEWNETYQRLRFGPLIGDQSAEDWMMLRQRYQSVKSELKKPSL